MAESAEKTIILPDNQNNGWGSIPLALALNGNGFGNNYPYPPYAYGNGGLFGGNGSGFGAGILGGLLGGLIWGGLGNGFGWGNGGWGNNGGAAASLGAQATAISNTDTILRAIDGTDADVRLLATTLNTDVNTVKQNLATIQNGLTQISGQTGLSAQQIINAIQQGDASLASQLCQCCCEMRQLTVEQGYQNQIRTLQQTETLGGAINGSGQRTVDAIADLKTTMVKEFCDVKEREMQEKINSLTANNTLLRSQIDNANQTAAIGAMIAPIAREVDDIKCKLPQTVPVQWPQLQAVNTTPYVSGGYYGMQPGFGWGGGYFGGFGNGFGGNIVF